MGDQSGTGKEDIDFVPQAGETEESMQARFQFIDVRETWECEALPVANAIHMPTSAFDISALEVAKDRELLVVCAKGVRSRAAADYLRAQGWRRAYSLMGGVPALHGNARP